MRNLNDKKRSKNRFQQQGDGVGSLLIKLGPVLLPILAEALKKPAEAVGDFIADKFRKLTGGAVSKNDITKLINMLQKGEGAKLPGGSLLIGNGNRLPNQVRGGSKYVTHDIGMSSVGNGIANMSLKKKF